VLTKILVTLLVICAALFYLRSPAKGLKISGSINIGQQILIRYFFYALVAIALLGSSGYWYWDWQDGNQIVSVTIISPLVANSVVYKVRKKDISDNRIITLDGINIRLSNSERVIVAPER